MLATGNSLVISGDMTRRALVCSLDAGVERPELREFDFNPVDMAKRGCAGYLVAALTILRAFHIAGSPRQAKPLGSFESWSDRVRGALLWLGMADPCLTMERARRSDPKLSGLREVLYGLHHVFSQRKVRVREIIDEATAPAGSLMLGAGFSNREYKHPDLREALLSVAGDGGAINSKRLGKWLSANLGRPVNGLRLMEAGEDRNGVKLWMLDSCELPV
jgi:putative DNA primase/helicase